MQTLSHLLLLYLVFFNTLYARSSELHVTFEVVNAPDEYKEIIEQKKEKYKKLGLHCYIKKINKNLSLRCNDTRSTKEYNNNLKLLEFLKIRYKVVSIEEYVNHTITPSKTSTPLLRARSKSLYTLRDGYTAYKKQDFQKAKKIFLELFNDDPNEENTYAFALIYLEQKNYARVRKLLEPFTQESQKATKLFCESVTYEFYNLVDQKKEIDALSLRDRYLQRYPSLKNLKIKLKDKTLSDGYQAYENHDYKKAREIFSTLHKKENNFDTAYAMALISLQYGHFEKLRNYIFAYKYTHLKAKKLFYDSIVTQYYIYLKFGKNKEAFALQKRYIREFSSLKKLAKPEKKYNLKKGYKAYSAKKYEKAKEIFLKLYEEDKNLENSYALALVAYKQEDYKVVREYLEYYRIDSAKSSNLYYNSIVKNYYHYCKEKKYLQAVSFLKRYKKVYPKLKKINDALLKKASILIEKEQYEEAEELLLANNFKDTNKYIFNGKYKKALKLRQESQSVRAAKLLMPFVPHYIKASTFYGEVTFERVSKYMANKEFKNAKYLLAPILLRSKKAKKLYKKIKYEQHIYEGWRSYNLNHTQKALRHFEKACDINYDKSCLVGIMNSLYKLQKYKKSLLVAKKMYKEDGSQEAVYIAYKSAKALNNIRKMKFWRKLLSYKYKKKILYESEVVPKNYKDIQSQYISLIKDNSNDFELVEKYLYFLKNIKKYKIFENILFNAKENFYASKEQKKLQTVQMEYNHERLYGYFKEGKNEQCFQYGGEVLTHKDGAEYKRIHAWCAYKSKHYDIAIKLFDNIIYNYGSSADDRYARFLSAFKARKFKLAKIYLKDMQKHYDKRDKVEVANFYIAIGAIEEAQNMIETISDPQRRDDLQHTINKSYKYNTNKIDTIGSGASYKKRNVVDGLHNFTQYYLPIDIDLYDDKMHHYYLNADVLHLYDEFRGSHNVNSMQYGLGWVYDEDKTMAVTTFLPNIGVDLNHFKIEFGSTPIGADLDPTPTANLNYHTNFNQLNFTIAGVRKIVDDSMLSLIGLQIYRDSKLSRWGRVVKNGIELSVNWSDGYFYSLDLGYYPLIEGENVMDNAQTKVVGVLGYSIPTSRFAYFDISFMGLIDRYEKNSDSFTYGHGGYFSPEYFALGSLVFEVGKNIDSKTYYTLNANIGYEKFSVKSVDKYPILNSATAGLSGVIAGYEDKGLTYQIKGSWGKKISKSLDFIGGVSYEEMKKFNMYKFGFSFVYSFDVTHKVNLFNIHTEHRMRSMLN